MSVGPDEAEIRQLTIADLPCLSALSRCVGWNQTRADWTSLLELEPEGCRGIEVDGRVVATATLLRHGDQLAWLGMVLTHPDYRRRGLARQLVRSCLDMAEVRGISTIKLDATESGLPLYESFGFVREQTIERWSGRGNGGSEEVRQACDKPDFALDRSAFGADRSALLRKLAGNGFCRVSQDGFVMTRPGANADYLGPCVARSQEAARLLIRDGLATGCGDYFWDVLPENVKALELAQEFQFQRARRLVRMRRGADVRGMESMVYAIGGFELG